MADDIRTGFVIESLERAGDFMNKEGGWEKNSLEKAYLFVGGPSEINDLLRSHKSFLKIFRVEELKERRIVTQRMTIRTFSETSLPGE